MIVGWEDRWASRFDIERKYGLFGEEDDSMGGFAGRSNDNQAAENEAQHGGGGGDDREPDGNEPRGSSRSSAADAVKRAHDPMGDIFGGLAAAQKEAAGIIAEATKKAAAEIRHGMEAAAKATIEAAKLAANAVLEKARISDARLREFWGAAVKALNPIIRQGRFASDEVASMLNIQDSYGRKIKFDTSSLEETPGYQFAFDQGQKAVDNSAVGTALSGAHAKSLVEYGQGMANQRFDTHLNQLLQVSQGGWNAARDKANAATQTGTSLAQAHTQAGTNLANIYSNRGNQLADISMTGSGNIANTYMGGAEMRAGLITGLATAGANIQMAQLNHDATIQAAQISADAQRSNSRSSGLGTLFGAFAPSIVKGVAGWISDVNIKEDVEDIDANAILEKVGEMSIPTWRYIGGDAAHIGPMAQDFKAAFDLGESDKYIEMVDANGVLMAAVQALYKRVVQLEGNRNGV